MIKMYKGRELRGNGASYLVMGSQLLTVEGTPAESLVICKKLGKSDSL